MHPPLKGTVSEKCFLDSVMPQFYARKSDSYIKKTHDYYSNVEQNLWENDYRSSDKLRRIGQVKFLTEKADKAANKAALEQKLETQEKKQEELHIRRVQSANRSSSRKVEQALLVVSSSQQITEEQKKLLTQQVYHEDELRKIIISRSGQLSHIHFKAGENSWNRLEKSSNKQLSLLYNNFTLKKEEAGLENLKQRKAYDDKLQEQRDNIIQENKKEIQRVFSERQLKNRQVNLIQTKKAIEPAEKEMRECSPLYERLSKPKEGVKVDQKELPEFREFLTNQLNYLDILKNPILSKYFEKWGSVNIQQGHKKQIGQRIKGLQIKEGPNEMDLLDTIDRDNVHMFERCFESIQVMKDLEDFDAGIEQRLQIERFSKIKNEENNYLKNIEGFKKLKGLKKQNVNTYRIEIGNELRSQVFQSDKHQIKQ